MPVWEFFQGIYTFFQMTPDIAFARLFLIALGFVFLYYGYKQVLEPLLMVPMGIGMIAVNGGLMMFEAGNIGTLFVHPLTNNIEELMYYLQIDFLQPIYTFTFSNGLIACLVFMGIGAITEIDYFIARPFMSMFLAVCAEFGTVFTLPIAMAWGLMPKEAAAISLVGGADGPMVLFGSIIMAKNLFVPITIVAYLYLSVCYAGYPLLLENRARQAEGHRDGLARCAQGLQGRQVRLYRHHLRRALPALPGGGAALRLVLRGPGR